MSRTPARSNRRRGTRRPTLRRLWLIRVFRFWRRVQSCSAGPAIEVVRPVPGARFRVSHAMEFGLTLRQHRQLGGSMSRTPARSNGRRGTRRPTLRRLWLIRVFRFWRRIQSCSAGPAIEVARTRPWGAISSEPRNGIWTHPSTAPAIGRIDVAHSGEVQPSPRDASTHLKAALVDPRIQVLEKDPILFCRTSD